MMYIILSLLMLPGLMAQPKHFQSRWHEDGPDSFTIGDYHQKNNVLYLVTNNQDYLFLNLIIPFPAEQQKILLLGLTVYVNLAGKSRKDLAIHYPFRRTGKKYGAEITDATGAAQNRPMMSGRNPSGMGNPGARPLMNFEVLKYTLAEGSRIMVLEGYADTAEIVAIPSTDPSEIHGLMVFDSSGALHYSLTIPFAKVPIRERLKKSGFSVGLETGFINPEQSMAGRGNQVAGPGGMGVRPGGAMGPGGAARGGGSMGSGRPGGRNGRPMMDPQQRQSMMEQVQALSNPTKFWIKNIKLAETE